MVKVPLVLAIAKDIHTCCIGASEGGKLGTWSGCWARQEMITKMMHMCGNRAVFVSIMCNETVQFCVKENPGCHPTQMASLLHCESEHCRDM